MSARTREVAERLVAARVAPAVTLPVVVGSEDAALPEDYVGVCASDLAPDGLGGLRCTLTVTANVPGDAEGSAQANAAEHALLTARLSDFDAAALALYAQPTGFVRAWEIEGREDTPTEGARVLCVLTCSICLPPCEDPDGGA